MKKIKSEFSGEKIIIYSVIALMLTAATVMGIVSTVRINKVHSKEAVVIYNVTQTQPDSSGKEAVYVSPSGKKYHRDGCNYLNENKIFIIKEDAINAGYEACGICQP